MSEQHHGLAQAQKLLQQLRQDFLADLPDRIDEAESLALSLEHSQQNNDNFNTLYREIHNIKGSAGTHGIPSISVICHNIEDAMQGINTRAGATPETTDTILRSLDLVRRAIRISAEEHGDFSPITMELDNILQRHQQGKYTGLIVEGSTFMSHLYASTLGNNHVEFREIKDGLEALSLLLHQKFDLVIMGAETKTLNGTALLYALHASGGANRHIRTIMVTSKDKPKFAAGMAPDFLLQKNEDLSAQLDTVIKQVVNAT